MKKRLLFAMIALAAAAAAVLFVSCGKDSGGQEGTGTSEAVPAGETEYVRSGYTIVRSDEDENDTVIAGMRSVRDAIKEKYEVTLLLGTDFLFGDAKPGEREILIGDTNREETRTVKAGLKNGQYAVRVVNGKIVLIGMTDALTASAVEYFINNVVESGSMIADNYSYTGEEPVKITSLTVNGTPVSEYRIVYESKAVGKDAAQILKNSIAGKLGFSPATASKNSTEGENEFEFVIGKCGRNENRDTLNPGDCVCYVKGSRIYFDGYNADASIVAVGMFVSEYLSGEGDVSLRFADGEYLFSYKVPAREEYLADVSAFVPSWVGSWTPTERLMNYQKKIDTLMQTDKTRLFTVAYRGDTQNYPENSVEAFISAWMMGADCVETDVRFTKDGIPVLMHDETLTRTTNSSEYVGKTGYPETENVSDWTFAQLRELRLKAGMGGSKAVLTVYKVASLEEALSFCKNRMFIICDKAENWRYAEIDGIQKDSAANYLYPWMKKTGNFESVLIACGTFARYYRASKAPERGTLTAGDALKIQKYVYDNEKEKMYFFLRTWTVRGTSDPYAAELNASSLTNSGIQVNGAFDPNNTDNLRQIKALAEKYPESMLGAWTIDVYGYDRPEVWDIMYETGLRSVMTNDIMSLVKYAASK